MSKCAKGTPPKLSPPFAPPDIPTSAMHQVKSTLGILAALLLAACAGEKASESPPVKTADAKALIEQSLPRGVSDRAGWTTDMYGAFTVLTIAPNRENICAVIAVIEQESGF